MKINFVMPNVASGQSGSAGLLMIYEYVNRLAQNGHEISIVPLMYYGSPQVDAQVIFNNKKECFNKLNRYYNTIINKIIGSTNSTAKFLDTRFDQIKSAITNMPECDINIATAYQTVLPVYLSAKGVPFYFIQHFEEYFIEESNYFDISVKDASVTYNLPLHKITNSSWVSREILSKYPNQQIAGMVSNAIDTDIFYPRNKYESTRLRILSHSGRNKKWKGFIDAVQAMRLVRKSYPDIEWWVYGDEGLVPPVNEIASYNSYGFVKHGDLPEIYSAADIVLCPSWYESFPMPPIEAMACGTAVITTPFGAEDYAKDGENCLLVPPKNPEKMAEAVIRLIENKSLRMKLVEEGRKTASMFTWERAVEKFEKILLDTVQNIS